MSPRVPKAKDFQYTKICTKCEKRKCIDHCFSAVTDSWCKLCKTEKQRAKTLKKQKIRARFLTIQLKQAIILIEATTFHALDCAISINPKYRCNCSAKKAQGWLDKQKESIRDNKTN